MSSRILLAVFLFMAGASIFSFLNVVIYRVPRGQSFIKGFSRCSDCGHRLNGWDLVPVLSWLIHRGRCGYCGMKIPSRYAGIELIGGFAALLCVIKMNYSLAALTAFAFLGILTVVAFVDIDTMEIPNGFVLTALMIGVLSIYTNPALFWVERLIGMFSVSLPLLWITQAVPGAFGGGDIKLMAACGLLLGWKLSLVSLFLAILSGGSYGVWLLASRKKGRKEHFAFGPFLCIGMASALFWGQDLLDWYLSFFLYR